VIARTEVMRAASYATVDGAKSTGLKLNKQWLTAGDGQGERHAQDAAYAGLHPVGNEHDQARKPTPVRNLGEKFGEWPSGTAKRANLTG
jgi:hypothetical protein